MHEQILCRNVILLVSTTYKITRQSSSRSSSSTRPAVVEVTQKKRNGQIDGYVCVMSRHTITHSFVQSHTFCCLYLKSKTQTITREAIEAAAAVTPTIDQNRINRNNINTHRHIQSETFKYGAFVLFCLYKW